MKPFHKALLKPILFSFFVFCYFQTFSQNLFPVFDNQKFGVVDSLLNEVVEKKFSYVRIFDNYFAARLNDKFAIFDEKGNQLSNFSFTDVSSEITGILKTYSEKKYGIFANGKKVLNPEFDEINVFSTFLYIVQNAGKYRVFDLKNNSFSEEFDEAYIKNSQVVIFSKENRKYILDLVSGTNKPEPFDNYFFQYPDQTDPLFFAYRQNSKLKFVKPETKISKVIEADSIIEILTLSKAQGGISSFLNFASNTDLIIVSKQGKKGALNLDFNFLMSVEFDYIRNDIKNNLKVSKNNKFGIWSFEGKCLVPAKYDDFQIFDDYVLVRNNGKVGVVMNGVELIPPTYDDVQKAGDFFIVKNNSLFGVSDNRNRLIIQPEYVRIGFLTNSFKIKNSKAWGLANLNGKIIVSPKYTDISNLGEKYFKINDSKDFGIMDFNGKIIVPVQYPEIEQSPHPEIFKISGKEIIQSYNPTSGRFEKVKRTGYINSYQELMLDTIYSPFEIEKDFLQGMFKVKGSEGILIVSFEEDGKIIDKINYEDYIFVKKEYKDIGNKSNYWAKDKFSVKFGLYRYNKTILIDPEFSSIAEGFLGRGEFTKIFKLTGQNELTVSGTPITTISGVANKNTGKILISPVYYQLQISDFKNSIFSRCFSASGVRLMDKECVLKPESYAFVGGFENGYARYNIGGKLISEPKNPEYRNYIGALKQNLLAAGHESSVKKFVSGGKWGVMDTSSNKIIASKYQYLSLYHNGIFLAKMNNKCGIINLKDEIILDFTFDDIDFFYKDSTQFEYSDIPFYKIKLKNAYGVADQSGKIIVPAQFNDIYYIQTKKDLYFITTNTYKDYRYGYVDSLGKTIIIPKYISAGKFKEDRARVQINKYRWGFVDTQGTLIGDFTCRESRDFCEGFAAVKILSMWCFLDKDGKQVFDKLFSEIGDFSEGFAKVGIVYEKKMSDKKEIRYGYINKNGEIVIKPKFNSTKGDYKAGSFKNGLAIVKIDNEEGIIDTTGKFKFRPKEKIEIYRNEEKNIFAVDDMEDKKIIFLNSKAQKFQFNSDSIKYYLEGFPEWVFRAYNNYYKTDFEYTEEVKSIENKNELITSSLQEYIEDFSQGKAAYRTKNLYGVYNSKGEEITPTKYLKIFQFENGLIMLRDIGEISYLK